VRADQEAGVRDEGFGRTVSGLADRIAQDYRRDRRPGGRDPFPNSGDVTAREPDRFDEPAGLAAGLAENVLEHGLTVLN